MEDNTSVWVLGHRIKNVPVSGNFDMVQGETPPGVPGPPPHYHTGYSETFLVTEGEMEFIINGEAKTVTTGQSVDLPVNTIHTFRNAGNQTCKWVNIHSPKGFLSFFNTFGVKESEENALKKSIDESIIEKVMNTAPNFDMHIKI